MLSEPWFPDLAGDDHSPDAWLGGELTVDWALAAYPRGFFPWPSDEETLSWWCPRVRMVFEPGGFHISRSLRRTLRRGRYAVTFDQDFEAVIDRCRDKRGPDREATWITPDVREVFLELARRGLAHSAEARRDGRLVGGIYGLALGGIFFGESMFADERDASKVALATLMAHLVKWDFELFDAQVPNSHLSSLGGMHMARSVFLNRLRHGLQRRSRVGPWHVSASLVERLARGGRVDASRVRHAGEAEG